MFSKEYSGDWTILISIGIVLFFLYDFSLVEMFKRILEVAFTWTGYKLFIENNKDKLKFGFNE